MLQHFRTLVSGSAIALAGLFSLTAGAASPAPAVDDARPALVDTLAKGGVTVAAKFDAGSGLTGWVMSAGPGQNMAMFTTEDGKRALVGNLLDENGVNLTTKFMDQYAPKIDYEKRFADVEKSAYVIEGAKQKKDIKQILYVFKDANCGYCHQIWNNLQPYMDGGLQVRWIPVAFLARDSANKAAALMTAKDPEATLRQLHAEWGSESSLSSTEVSLDVKKKLDANKILMESLGIQGTPAMLYKDKDGKVQFKDGSPSPAELQRIVGFAPKLVK